MATDNEIYTTFVNMLWRDIQHADTFPVKRPLLAHYTSIASLESIMDTNEVWFSNPLYMSDIGELRFGILESAHAFRQNKDIESACGNSARYNSLANAFEYQLDQFSNKHAFDTYVFCLSEHDSKNTDGLLSMWRGYGSNGNGAAIVFDTAQLNHVDGSPLIISKVSYASQAEQLGWIGRKLSEFADLIRNNHVPDEKLHLPAYALFARFKIFSIFTKHHGFLEENEWRVVYMKEFDRENKLEEMLSYTVGKRGIEPKLKLQVRPIEGLTIGDISLEKLVHQIILGPSVSSPFSIAAVQRMLEKVGKRGLVPRLAASTTPFRPM